MLLKSVGSGGERRDAIAPARPAFLRTMAIRFAIAALVASALILGRTNPAGPASAADEHHTGSASRGVALVAFSPAEDDCEDNVGDCEDDPGDGGGDGGGGGFGGGGGGGGGGDGGGGGGDLPTVTIYGSAGGAVADGSPSAPGDFSSGTAGRQADQILADPPPPSGNCTYNGDLRGMIGRHEGTRAHVYVDSQGHPSVGIGFNLDRPDARSALAAVGANYDQVRAGTADLNGTQIQNLFTTDLIAAENRANKWVPNFSQLSSGRRAALIDMSFNLGNKIGLFVKMIAAIQAGDFNGAAIQMDDSAWAYQVGTGRSNELTQMMKNCS